MAASRTIREQSAHDRAEQRTGKRDGFFNRSEVPTDDIGTSGTGSKSVHAPKFDVKTDDSRDALLTEFGKDTLRDRYLLPGESYQDLFARVAAAYADDPDHAQRVYDYISRLWFMPATPVLSNGGTGRGLPISCYLNSVSDSLDGIVIPGTKTSGWLPRAAASALIGAMCAALASRSASTARPAASSRSSASWTA